MGMSRHAHLRRHFPTARQGRAGPPSLSVAQAGSATQQARREELSHCQPAHPLICLCLSQIGYAQLGRQAGSPGTSPMRTRRGWSPAGLGDRAGIRPHCPRWQTPMVDAPASRAIDSITQVTGSWRSCAQCQRVGRLPHLARQ